MQELYNSYNSYNYKYEDYHIISIDITSVCNFRCEYCYARNYWNTFKLVSLNKFIDIVEHFHKLLPNKFLVIYLVGGEPLTHPKLNQILEFCYTCNYISNVELYTNGYFDLSKLHNNPKLKVILSIHPSQTLKHKDYTSCILANLKLNFSIEIQLMDFRLNLVKDLLDIIKNTNITLTLAKIFNPKTNKEPVYDNYDADKYHTIYYNGKLYNMTEMYNTIRPNIKNWKCYINHISVDVNGYVSVICKDFGLKYYELETFPEYIRCPYDYAINECCLNYYKCNE